MFTKIISYTASYSRNKMYMMLRLLKQCDVFMKKYHISCKQFMWYNEVGDVQLMSIFVYFNSISTITKNKNKTIYMNPHARNATGFAPFIRLIWWLLMQCDDNWIYGWELHPWCSYLVWICCVRYILWWFCFGYIWMLEYILFSHWLHCW